MDSGPGAPQMDSGSSVSRSGSTPGSERMDSGPGARRGGSTPGTPPDRRVVFLIALLVVGVLALNLASAILPGVDGVLASLPLVVLGLVLGTVLVLLRSLRRG